MKLFLGRKSMPVKCGPTPFLVEARLFQSLLNKR
jgi:hypothetical protein